MGFLGFRRGCIPQPRGREAKQAHPGEPNDERAVIRFPGCAFGDPGLWDTTPSG